VPYLALLQSKGEAQTPSSTPRASSQSFSPYRRLLSSAVITSSVPAPYAPPPTSSSPSQHHHALGYLTDLSFLTDEHPSDLSPELSLRPSSPSPRAHTGEPPSVQKPKLGSSSSRACATAISSLALAVGRSDFTGEPPKQPSKLGRVGPGSVLEWAGLAGHSKVGSSGAVHPWAAFGPRGRICLNFIFRIIFGLP
jgi:hypothetical protein